MTEWFFLVVSLLSSDLQRDSKVRCHDSICYAEFGGFSDPGGCTLALLVAQENIRKQGGKIMRLKDGKANKCRGRPAVVHEVDR